jgi:hypothetical protein
MEIPQGQQTRTFHKRIKATNGRSPLFHLTCDFCTKQSHKMSWLSWRVHRKGLSGTWSWRVLSIHAGGLAQTWPKYHDFFQIHFFSLKSFPQHKSSICDSYGREWEFSEAYLNGPQVSPFLCKSASAESGPLLYPEVLPTNLRYPMPRGLGWGPSPAPVPCLKCQIWY